MQAKFYTMNYTSIIDKLDLEELQKEQLKVNWLYYIEYLESLISRNISRYKLFTTISIIGGISIPALSAFQIPEPYNKMAVSLIGVITASCIGLNQSFKFNDKWKHFRLQAEISRIEGEKFIALSGESYKEKSHKLAMPIFIEKLSLLKNEEIKDYFDTVNNILAKDNGK
jgi:hypothetical protein